LSAKGKKGEQLTLEFADNALLAALGGSQHRNFVHIEKKLDVRVDMRGNLVSIEGLPAARERAAAVLRSLYARIEAGESVNASEIDAEIRFAAHERDNQPSRDFGQASIKTAVSRVTRARSPAQAA
jgi:phosphate starvation-inducible PhoH-like protein